MKVLRALVALSILCASAIFLAPAASSQVGIPMTGPNCEIYGANNPQQVGDGHGGYLVETQLYIKCLQGATLEYSIVWNQQEKKGNFVNVQTQGVTPLTAIVPGVAFYLGIAETPCTNSQNLYAWRATIQIAILDQNGTIEGLGVPPYPPYVIGSQFLPCSY